MKKLILIIILLLYTSVSEAGVKYPQGLNNAEKFTFLLKFQEKLRRWNNENVKIQKHPKKWHKENFLPKNKEISNEILKVRPLVHETSVLDNLPWIEEKNNIRALSEVDINLEKHFD